MGIEKKIETDEYGRKRYILESDKVIKLGDKLICVRLIQIEKWKDRFKKNPELTPPMPRAKFLKDESFENPYYLIRKTDFEELKRKGSQIHGRTSYNLKEASSGAERCMDEMFDRELNSENLNKESQDD